MFIALVIFAVLLLTTAGIGYNAFVSKKTDGWKKAFAALLGVTLVYMIVLTNVVKYL